MSCPAPDPSLETTIRIAQFMDCNAEVLGREGFLALADYAVSDGMLVSIFTVSVALIGYRLMLGERPTLADGAGWFLRIGLITALLSGWTVFQTLFYDVVVLGPEEISSRLLGQTGVSLQGASQRTQEAYDALRTGLAEELVQPVEESTELRLQADFRRSQAAMPGAASGFFYIAIGLQATVRMIGAFLLAIAPFPIMAMMFSPSWGFFVGWVRALLTTVLIGVGMTIVKALHLASVESEIAEIRRQIRSEVYAEIDWQGITAFNSTFSLIALVMLVATIVVSAPLSSLLLPMAKALGRDQSADWSSTGESAHQSSNRALENQPEDVAQSRAATIVDALTRVVSHEREVLMREAISSPSQSAGVEVDRASFGSGASTSVRRAIGRRHRSIARRDRSL